MITEQELKQLISGGETATTEFKRDDVRPERLAREIVGMANAQGGLVLLGVEDSGEISGIQRKNLQDWVYDTVLGRYVFPALSPRYAEVKIGKQRVAVISLEEIDSIPYVLRSNSREEIFIRCGSVTRQASLNEQRRLFERGGLLHSECLPVSRAFFPVLDKVRLENYLRDIIRDPEIPATEAEWIERLTRLGLMTQNSFGEDVATVAGLVLFGVKPRRFLRQAGIRIMVFEGLDMDYRARLDTVLDAPLVGRWLIEEGGRSLIDQGLIEKMSDSLAPFISEEPNTIDENFRREKKWFYPTEAVREVVVNALAHRDWTRTVDVEAVAYADRLEIKSPGPFQNSMTVEKMVAGQRSTRNQIIVEILKDYGYVDSRGMGIRTKVMPLMQARGVEPVFEATEDYVKTVLGKSALRYLPPAYKESQQSIQVKEAAASLNAAYNRSQATPSALSGQLKPKYDLLEAIKRAPNADYQSLANTIGVSPATVKRRIQKLKSAGKIQRIGSKKTGYWQVSE